MGSVSLLNKVFGVIATALVLNACAELDTEQTVCSDPTCTNQSPVTSSRLWPFSNDGPAVQSKGRQGSSTIAGIGDTAETRLRAAVRSKRGFIKEFRKGLQY